MLYRSLTALLLATATALPAFAQDQLAPTASTGAASVAATPAAQAALSRPISSPETPANETPAPATPASETAATAAGTPTPPTDAAATPAASPTEVAQPDTKPEPDATASHDASPPAIASEPPAAATTTAGTTTTPAAKPETSQPVEAASVDRDAPPAETRDAGAAHTPDAASAATTANAETNGPDAIPAGADPLTPPPEDTGPTRAPGAPERATAAPRAVTQADPALDAIRAKLAAAAESRRKADQNDLAALKAFYADPGATRIWTSDNGFTPRADAAAKALARADQWGLEASAFDLPTAPPPGASSDAVADAEVQFGIEVLKYARFARGGRTDPSAISKLIDMRPHLYEPQSVLEAVASAPDAGIYLETLQPKHAGFVNLKKALARLRSESQNAKANASEERRLLANMERWRWLPDDLGKFYVWDNIPEQITRVIHDGKPVHQAKIVVGKPSTPTPVFSMPMRFVIFNPTWGVPDGIKSNELGPMLRRAQANSSSGWFFSQNDGASRVLRRQQLRVYSGGREINPDSINWSSADVRRFSFVQPASGSNVLGVVKFRFPNKHDVYMHDTPQRHLFAQRSRAFSHGCMRVQDPLKLAEVILSYDKGWSRGRIDQIVARGTTTDVTLEKKVNVHIVYFTASADEAGKLHTYPDVYGIDSRVASALAGRSVVLSSARASDDVSTETNPSPTHARRPKPKPRPVATAQPNPPARRTWTAFPTSAGN